MPLLQLLPKKIICKGKLTRGSFGRVCVAHLSFCIEETLYRIFHKCFLPNFNYYHKQELPMAAMEILYRLSDFRGEDFLVIDKPERIMAYCGHVCKQIGTK